MYNFGAAIKKLREDKEMTQQELANLSGIGRSTINAYELGTRHPTAKKLGGLARALGIPPGLLFYMAEQEHKEKKEGWGGDMNL